MPDAQISPISQLLHTLGITKEDLEKRSYQMRQFLTAEDRNTLRVADRDGAHSSSSTSDLHLLSQSTSSTSSISRSRSRTNSYSYRDSTPPTTPIKSELAEGSLRQFDSMEMVIERQRRQNRKDKRERRERERESMTRAAVPHPPSPSPSNTSQSSFNLDAFMHSRDDQRVMPTDGPETALSTLAQPETHAAPPVTPKQSKYYRDHTVLSGNPPQSRQDELFTLKAESPTPTQARLPSFPESQPRYYAYPQYLVQARYLPSFGTGQASASANPVTPQHQRTYAPQRMSAYSPLPPSSPPPTSSPIATPSRRVVNLVSSPGPMGPLPDEEEYDTLPYTLPPGPYSPNKPDLSYAALVGRAILSSPDHRLTLQEIYDWITIVFPHFKRGEQTWMNSIRHVLSTTVCFRKVPRERSVGRTQWAIFDDDLECFKGGGFRKQLCKDIMNGTVIKGKQAAPKAKKGKKRAAGDDESAVETHKIKRSKKDNSTPLPTASITSAFVPATMSSHPLFPPTRPTHHHQPYYQSCLPQQPQHRPGGIIFPPLPPGIGYTRYTGDIPATELPSSSLESQGSDTSERDSSPMSTEQETSFAPPSTISSVPELTPNRSSSSPLPASSETDQDISDVLGTAKPLCDISASVVINLLDEDPVPSADREDEGDGSLLGQVKFLGGLPKTSGSGLQPGIELSFGGQVSEDERQDEPLSKRSKVPKRAETGKLKKWMSFPPIPTSPTLDRKAASKANKVSKGSISSRSQDTRLTTPPPPSTPPRNTHQLPTSSIRTPLAEKDLSINPAALSADADDDYDYVEPDIHRTPRKRSSDSGLAGAAPVTPRRLVFPTDQNDSPYRTPGYVYGTSPFRTPGSRAVFDPHDPATLLDEELSRMGTSGHGDSPAGLFGKTRGSLLYDSPGLHSPSQWQKWW